MSASFDPKITALNAIIVKNARTHNLKDISVTLPRHSLTVITGLSGSGKSSLAFDTIYAEGQRRYVESLSAYARQFLELMNKPDVESIEGLSPAISIEQKTTSKNPRSTVGTITEIHDYMRLLWARIGVAYSPTTGLPIEAQTISQMVDRILELPEGTRFMLLAPIIRDRKGDCAKDLAELARRGFTRVRIDNEIYTLDDTPKLNRKTRHDIDVIIDRLVLKENIQTRLAESLETALELSDGLVFLEEIPITSSSTSHLEQTEPLKINFSSRYSCPVSGFMLETIEPRLFSFNAPMGACPHCSGLGTETHFAPHLIIPDEDKTLQEGAIAPWKNENDPLLDQTLAAILKYCKESPQTSWKKLKKTTQDLILYGSQAEITFLYLDEKGDKHALKRPFIGVIAQLQKRLAQTNSAIIREMLARYQTALPCPKCNGTRLKPEALCVKIAETHIAQAADMTIDTALVWFQQLKDHLSPQNIEIATPILREIIERLYFLKHVGLTYLTLSRNSATLSGGESQRIRLASQIGSGLTGVLYVLDEPSIGLHQRDNERLLQTLERLKNLGNTVIVVEHDEDTIRQADYLIDMGPGAGRLGGEVIAAGTPKEVEKIPQSLTGQWLAGKRTIPIPSKPRKAQNWLTLHKASGNNLKNITARFPLGCFISVTGVSGSGKSSLVIDTLYKALSREIMKTGDMPLPYKNITGKEHINKIIDIDQSPIGRTPRSNPATYTDLFTPIREWFAELPQSKARGYKAGRFSFNVKGGRCEACQGDGVLKIEMHFLADIFVACDQCKGARYNRETLEIKFRGKTIADILAMTVDEALPFFDSVPRIKERLAILQEVGLGYITLGQQATTLSGGEAQRIKLSKELAKRATGNTLYILDEPTTGLHVEDVRKLLDVLHRLVDQGNTIIIIEHNLDLIKTSDWIIDIGPEGGDAGGDILCAGHIEDIINCPQSHTGKFLKPLINPSLPPKTRTKTK